MAASKKRLISVVESSSDGNINDVKDASVASSEIAQFVFTDVIGEDTDEESKNTSTFVYKKLVVPMNMRSVYWKCYGFPANDEGEILTKVKIICILCKTVISYNGNTSNLRMHLKSKHPQELQNLELDGSFKGNRKPRVDVKEKRRIKRQQQRVAASSKTISYVYSTTTDDAVHLNKNVDIVSDPNVNMDELDASTSPVKVLMKSQLPSHDNENLTTTYHLMQDDHHSSVVSAGGTAVGEEEEEELELQVHSEQSVFERKTISDAIAEFIILDLQLPQVVESAGFQNLVATLRSPCEIPSRVRLVEDIIPKLYNTFRESVLEDLSCASSDISLTVEEWKSDHGQKNVTITAHYLQQGQEDRLQSKVLLTHNCSPLYDMKHWSFIFDTLLTTWNINADKVKAVVLATTEEFLLMALKNKSFTLIPCLTFTLQEACMSGCFSYPDVDCVVSKIRLLLSLLYRCSNAVAVLRVQEHLLQLEDVSLVLDYPKIWISTYTMLEQLLARRSIMKLVTDAIGGSLYEKELLDITDEDWSLIEDVVNVLEPFKVTTMTLAEEKTPLISLLKPLVWQLISVHLKVREDTDSPLSQKIKLDLTEILKNKYSKESVDTMLKTATTLDPRFKQLPYAIEEVKAMLNGPIKIELIKMMEESSNTLSSDNNEKNQLNLKKSRLSGMEFLLGDLCTTSNSLSTNERAELEINQYQSEPTANLDHCPLIWWQKANIKFPNLAKLVSSYNCIPVTAIPPNRIPVESQISYDIKRAKILPEIIDKLVFLNANKPITF